MKIYHAKIVTPENVIENGTIEILEGKIASITEGEPKAIGLEDIDAAGRWVLPGLVDSHSDAIELELEPRPSSTFPIEISFLNWKKACRRRYYDNLSFFIAYGGKCKKMDSSK
ncbi:hypothetical protein MGI18_09180 [Bacillus sp. OVS6]|nr:hypothetical protein MGI18_09180 [Bacillus sp. OVS6]